MSTPIWTPGVKLDEIEKEIILAALRFYHWHRTRTAEALGISLRTMTSRVAEYRKQGVEIPESVWGVDPSEQAKRI